MWRELPYKKERSACRKFWKEPLKGTKILFYGHSLICFSPLRGNNSETTQLTLAVIFFCSRPYLRGSAKAPAVDLLELTTIPTNPAFFNPKKYDKHPFLYRSPPRGGVVPREITNCLTILKRGVVGSNGVGGPVKKRDPFKQRLVRNKVVLTK